MKEKVSGLFIKVPFTSSNLSIHKFAGIDSLGNAELSDNTNSPFITPVGIIRHLENNYVILQLEGEIQISSTQEGEQYWLSTNGNIINTPPSSGIVQKVGIGLQNNKLLVNIDTNIISI